MMVSDASLNTILAQAEFMPFAPAPCVCCGCLVSDAQRERTYWTVYGAPAYTTAVPTAIAAPCAYFKNV